MLNGLKFNIIFKDRKAQIASGKTLEIQDDVIQSYLDRFVGNVYFRVEIFKVFEQEHRVAVSLLSTGFSDEPLPKSQDKYLDELKGIEFINFKSIDTGSLMRALERNKDLDNSFVKDPITQLSEEPEEAEEPEKTIETEPEVEYFDFSGSFTYECPTEELFFFDGGAYFDLEVEELNQSVRVEIMNKYIKKEFSSILPYFNSIIGSDKLVVHIDIEVVKSELKSLSADCEEFKLIGDDFTEKVRYKLILDIDKADTFGGIFTSDSFVKEKTGKGINETDFFKSEEDFIEKLINQKSTKHFKHLTYLSERHLYKTMRVRLIFSPFAFLFLVGSENAFFVVWETLDTKEATWIWKIPKNSNESVVAEKARLRKVIEDVQDVINLVKTENKQIYIRKKVDNFKRVYHNYEEGGFDIWKSEFEEFMLG